MTATIALVSATLLLGVAVSRALVPVPSGAEPTERVEDGSPGTPLPGAVPDPGEAAPNPTDPRNDLGVPGEEGDGASTPFDVLRMAAERAPFSPDRRPPAQRYRMPGERVRPAPRGPTPPEPPPPAPPVRLLGTVAGGPEGGFALLQVEDETPVTVSEGEDFLGYRVSAIDAGRVVMMGDRWDVTMTVASPRRARIAIPSGRRNRNARRRAEREQAELAEERLRERAAEVQRQLQARVGGDVELEMDGDRVLIRGREGAPWSVQLAEPASNRPASVILMQPGGQSAGGQGGGEGMGR